MGQPDTIALRDIDAEALCPGCRCPARRASRRACFIEGLSRHSHAVRTDVPGMPDASRTCAADIALVGRAEPARRR